MTHGSKKMAKTKIGEIEISSFLEQREQIFCSRIRPMVCGGRRPLGRPTDGCCHLIQTMSMERQVTKSMRGESPRVKKTNRSNAVDRPIITNVKYELNQTGINRHRNSVLDDIFELHLALFLKWTNRPLVGVGP